MPTAPLRACEQCRKPSEPGSNYCAEHQKTHDPLERRKAYDQWRSTRPGRQLYGLAAWNGPNGLRLFTLRRDPICKICNARPSNVADHVKDHKGDTSLFFARDNVRGVCKECHDEKTALEWGFGGYAGKEPEIKDGTFVVSAFQGPPALPTEPVVEKVAIVRTSTLSAAALIALVRATQTR